jgi:hypothetical protein
VRHSRRTLLAIISTMLLLPILVIGSQAVGQSEDEFLRERLTALSWNETFWKTIQHWQNDVPAQIKAIEFDGWAVWYFPQTKPRAVGITGSRVDKYHFRHHGKEIAGFFAAFEGDAYAVVPNYSTGWAKFLLGEPDLVIDGAIPNPNS